MNLRSTPTLVFANSILAVFAIAADANAIVIVPSGSGNSVAPADDPGWQNVANRGVYIGDRWMLTAHHVGAGQTTFPDIGTFDFESGSDIRLTNPSGRDLSAVTDLVLYRLQTDPGLPSLEIASSVPSVGTNVMLVADGAVRDARGLLEWDVNWLEVSSGGVYSGYGSSGSGKRWATNIIDQTVVSDETLYEVNSGSGDVASFATTFDLTGGTLNEGHAAIGDSGGAIFSKDLSGNWELSGVIHAVSTYDGQPLPGQTAIAGNETFAADLSVYRSQILGVVSVPEPDPNMLLLLLLFRVRPNQRSRWRLSPCVGN